MRPVDVKSSTYIDFGVKNNEKDPKFNVRDQVRISRNKNNFAKGYIPNWWEQVIVIKNVKNTVLVDIFTVKKQLERSTKKNCKRQIKQNLE